MEDISDEAVQNRMQIKEIRRLYLSGEITRSEAKILAAPVIKRINKKSKEIAQKYGKKNYPVTDFINLMRNNI